MSAEWAVLSLRGPAADTVLATAGLPVPDPAQPLPGGGFIRRSPTLPETVDLIVTREAREQTTRALRDAGAAPVGSWAFEAVGRPETLFNPAAVSDRSDGKIAHLDGLNLSRAWAWRELAAHLPPNAAEIARAAAERHLDASLPHVAGDYMGEHWLATYAALALAVQA